MTCKIAMLADNSGLADHRIRKEAECLAEAGYEIRVFCKNEGGSSAIRKKAGVTYQALPVNIEDGLGHISGARTALKMARNFGRGSKKNSNTKDTDMAAQSPKQLGQPLTLHGRFRAALVDRLHLTQYWPAYRSALKDFSPNIIHAHDLATAHAGYCWAQRSGIPFIYDAHEFETSRHAPLPDRAWEFRRSLERKIARKAAKIITVSDDMADELAVAYQIDRPITIYNSPEVSASNSDANIREQLRISPDEKLGIYVGGYREGRGIHTIIKAVADFSGLHFAFVGIAPGGQGAQTVEGILSQYAPGLNVHFIAPVDPANLPIFLSTSDFAMIGTENTCLNHRYCMPNKLFECAFARVPLVVTPLQSISAFVNEYCAGEVAKNYTQEALKESVEAVILKGPEAYYPPLGFARMSEYHSWSFQRETLTEIYQKLTAQFL